MLKSHLVTSFIFYLERVSNVHSVILDFFLIFSGLVTGASLEILGQVGILLVSLSHEGSLQEDHKGIPDIFSLGNLKLSEIQKYWLS